MTHLPESNAERYIAEPAPSTVGEFRDSSIYRSEEARNGFTFTVNGLFIASALMNGHRSSAAGFGANRSEF